MPPWWSLLRRASRQDDESLVLQEPALNIARYLIKFYLDENQPAAIAILLRTLGIDAISSHECGNNGLSDEMQLAFAISQERCIITQDVGDFPELVIRADAVGARTF